MEKPDLNQLQAAAIIIKRLICPMGFKMRMDGIYDPKEPVQIVLTPVSKTEIPHPIAALCRN